MQVSTCSATRHIGEKIKLFCFSEFCRGRNIVCEGCVKKHANHKSVNFSKFSTTINRYLSQLSLAEEVQQEKEIKQELYRTEILSYSSSMRKDLECATLHIYKTKLVLENLLPLMQEISEMLLEVEEIAEEHDTINTLLSLLDSSQDITLLNNHFSNMILLLKPSRQAITDGGRQELIFKPTKICLVRSQSVLDRQHEFCIVLQHTMNTHQNKFSQFLAKTSNLVMKNQQLFSRAIKPKSILSADDPQVEHIFDKEEEREDILNIISSAQQQIMIRDLTGYEKYDTPEPFHGSRKQMIKLANYWIFYYCIICEGTFPEPVLQEITKKGKKILPAIRCVFCKLLTSKEYLNNYFRYDPSKRCGQLCWLKDNNGREILAHEMCLVWSNRVQLNYETYQVEFYSIIMAVQFAKTQKCRFCGNYGASLKCSRPDCQVHFHWHCLIQVKLMSMQLDFDARYRFYCEDHVIRTNRYKSDWFVTRIRMMYLTNNVGRVDLPRQMMRNDSDDDESSNYTNVKKQYIGQ